MATHIGQIFRVVIKSLFINEGSQPLQENSVSRLTLDNNNIHIGMYEISGEKS
jgi:hypothetical protein